MSNLLKHLKLTIATLVVIGIYSCGAKPDSTETIKIYYTNCNSIKAEHINPLKLITDGKMFSTDNNFELLQPDKTYWLYFEKNDITQPHVLSFSKNISSAQVYPHPFKNIEEQAGAMVAANNKTLPGSNLLINFEAPAYLIKVENKLHSKICADEITLVPLLKYQASQINKSLFHGFVQGCLWLMIIFNSILFFANKKLIHIYYVLFVICNSLYLFYSELYISPNSSTINHLFLTFQIFGLLPYVLFLDIHTFYLLNPKGLKIIFHTN
jgi:hypothetical protein